MPRRALWRVQAAAQVGHSGGVPVYRDGAASAYTDLRTGGNREVGSSGSPEVTRRDERLARGDRDQHLARDERDVR